MKYSLSLSSSHFAHLGPRAFILSARYHKTQWGTPRALDADFFTTSDAEREMERERERQRHIEAML